MDWKAAAARSDEAAKESGIFVRLEDDKDKTIGVVVGDVVAVRTLVWNETKGNYDEYDVAKHGEAARKKVNFVLNWWDAESDQVKVFEVNNGLFQDFVKMRDKYGFGPSAQYLFEVERHGKKGDTKTRYTIVPLPEKKVDDALRTKLGSLKVRSEAELLGKESPKGAASHAETVDAATVERLVARMKPHGRAIVDVVFPKFGIQQVKQLPTSKLAAFENAIAIEEERLRAPANGKKPEPTEVDPFAT